MGLPLRHGVLPRSVAHVATAHVMPVIEPHTSEGAGTSSSSTTAGAGGTHKLSPGAMARAQGVVREVRLLSSPLAWLPPTTAAGAPPQLPSLPSGLSLLLRIFFLVRVRGQMAAEAALAAARALPVASLLTPFPTPLPLDSC